MHNETGITFIPDVTFLLVQYVKVETDTFTDAQ